VRRIEKDRIEFQMLNSHVITAVVIFSIIFEIILPTISIRYTSDYLDILCYLLGGIIFTVFENQKNGIDTNSIFYNCKVAQSKLTK